MANMNKAKEVKKKGRRLRKSIRKTLGTLFLVSALVVAAIPADYLRADESTVPGQADISKPNTERDKMKVSIQYLTDESAGADWTPTSIPDVTQSSFKFNSDTTNIYTSENLVFDFAVSNMHGNGCYAVIVGYHNQNQLNNVGTTLTIPKTLDAYAPYGAESGLLDDSFSCAIGGTKGELLFYRTVVGYEYDADHNVTNTFYKYSPCLFQDKDTWESMEWNSKTNPNSSLYYVSGLTKYNQEGYKWEEGVPTKAIIKNADGSTVENDLDWVPANETMRERFKDIQVSYIANQYVVENTDGQNVVDSIKNVETASDGIFSTATVSTLRVEPNLIGIGKYAFAGTHIETVELSDSVVEIGSNAFERCARLRSFSIGKEALNVVIGDHAFANCKALTEFDARNVQKIGDSAFEACDLLGSVNLLETGTSGALSTIGYYAFAYCINLEELVFPSTYADRDPSNQVPRPLLVSTFEGCTKLNHIYATGETISFNVAEDAYYPFKKFMGSCSPNFYFEGPQGSTLENTVIPEYFVYKYSGQEIYKKRMPDKASGQPDGTYKSNAVFEVTRLGEGSGEGTGKITDVQIEPGLDNLEIPGKVGPLKIMEIGEGGFSGNSNLKNVIIPEAITDIGKNAFADCSNLQNVYFDNPWTLVSIGEDAFKTKGRELNFISGVSFKEYGNSIKEMAFKYAIEDDNVINDNLDRIAYYTGWPTNLKVENVSGKATLTEYPTFAGLASGALASYYYKPEYAAGYKEAAESAGNEALGKGSSGGGTQKDKTDAKGAVEDIVLPIGIVAIDKDLFKNGEAEEKAQLASGASAPKKKLTTYGLDGKIDDHAFEGAEYLTEVSILGDGVRSLGNAPFLGCNQLTHVDFGSSPYFRCDNSIIYELNTDGSKKVLVEYLNGRSDPDVTRSETAGVSDVRAEAFRGTNVKNVNLRDTTINKVYAGTFQDTPVLRSVELPELCRNSEEGAFLNSAVELLRIRNANCLLSSDVLKNKNLKIEGRSGGNTEDQANNNGIPFNPIKYQVTFWAEDETGQAVQLQPGKMLEVEDGKTVAESGIAIPEVPLNKDGQKYTRWKPDIEQPITDDTRFEAIYETTFYSVVFLDDEEFLEDGANRVIYENDRVPENSPINPPQNPTAPEGHRFIGWYWTENPETHKPETIKVEDLAEKFKKIFVTDDFTFIARYERIDSAETRHTVVFMDDDFKTVLSTMKVDHNDTLMLPQNPTKEGYIFVGWMPDPSTVTTVTTDMTFYAKWKESGDDPNNPGNQTPTPPPGPGGSSPTPSPGGTVPDANGTFSLQVYNGSGSGRYAPGAQIVITADPAPEGQTFIGWDVSPSSTVMSDKTRVVTILTMPRSDVAVLAKYEGDSGSTNNGKLYNLQVSGGSGSGTYPVGAQVIITADAAPENQQFSGWDVSPAETVVADKTKVATIITMPEGDVAAIANYNSTAAAATPTPAPSTLHSLLVHNGSGSGSYAVGAQVVIVANNPAAGQEFTGWTVSPDSTVITDKTLPGAVITMPDNDVAVIANYRSTATGSGNTGSSNNTNTNNGTNSNNNNNNNSNNSNSGNNSNTSTNRPSSSTNTNSGTTNRGGTTVVIDKNGLSNTGVVSATVHGSSDNFTIKITESSEATEAVLNALLAEYGSVDNIKYFPMDISLYDSTGNTKITDTTGLSVSITLPLPDSLITYAGNNKVAGVVNNRLDKLTPRFTTINGVYCVTFTAEHFSPYVIYVDVSNLSSGTVTDATPTTGDGIHPKWFLSIGLACLSFVMFMMKDGEKASAKKRKVKVRA